MSALKIVNSSTHKKLFVVKTLHMQSCMDQTHAIAIVIRKSEVSLLAFPKKNNLYKLIADTRFVEREQSVNFLYT